MRDLWAQLKESVSAAADRVSPGVLIATGLAAVVLAFGALGLSLLADDGSGLDDLDLGAPPDRAAEGDATSGADGTGAGGIDGDPLSEGLTTNGPAAGGDSGDGADGPAAGEPRGENALAAPGAPSPTADAGSPTTASPTTRPTTTSPSVPGTTVPATTATTADPPSTPTTAEPPHEAGVIGGLLDLLGLG